MINKVIVFGAGAMGAAIAQITAQAGKQVWLCDIEDRFVQAGMEKIKANLDKRVAKGKIADAAPIMARITPITDFKQAGDDIDLVIEAIIESVPAKQELFAKLDAYYPEKTIFATNTSAISITEIAYAVKRPDKFIGMHFFNPVVLLKLIELARGLCTSDETFAIAREFCLQIGKDPVEVRESPGFVVNRLVIPMLNEAIFVLESGIASAEDIDKALVLGADQPTGPLHMADHIGLDVVLAVIETLHRDLGDKYRPAPLLKKMVKAGKLGQKTGEGFFVYNK